MAQPNGCYCEGNRDRLTFGLSTFHHLSKAGCGGQGAGRANRANQAKAIALSNLKIENVGILFWTARVTEASSKSLTLFRSKSYHSVRTVAGQPPQGPEAMSSFGENLRREREMRGVTLEEMSETTKISVRLLSALEQDHFAELPGGVFTRSFIRAYAQYLGLDEEHVLSEYKRVAKPATDNDLSRLTPDKIFSEKSPRTRVLPWVIIAALLGSGYAVYRYSRRSLDNAAAAGRGPSPSSVNPEATPAKPQGSDTAPGTGQAADSSQTARGSETQPSSSTVGSTGGSSSSGTANGAGNSKPEGSSNEPPPSGSGAQGANAGAPVLGEGEMVLQVTTSEEAWIAVAADGKTLMQHLLPPNSTRIFRAKDAFDVTTGNAQGTVLTFNGAAQKALGREGEFKRVHLARSLPQNSAH